jgi:hypothetical protein
MHINYFSHTRKGWHACKRVGSLLRIFIREILLSARRKAKHIEKGKEFTSPEENASYIL